MPSSSPPPSASGWRVSRRATAQEPGEHSKKPASFRATCGATWSAEATVRGPVAGIGLLSWISVNPVARGRGLGSVLLGSALDLLAALGADQVILYVDDDAPPGDAVRDRTAAHRKYDRAGLKEIDRLFSFTRHPWNPGST